MQFEGQRLTGVFPLEQFLTQTQLAIRLFPNTGGFDIPVAVTGLLPKALPPAPELRHTSQLHQRSPSREAGRCYWQPVNPKVEAVTLLPAVTDSRLPFDLELVCRSDGEQSEMPPLPGSTACASMA